MGKIELRQYVFYRRTPHFFSSVLRNFKGSKGFLMAPMGFLKF